MAPKPDMNILRYAPKRIGQKRIRREYLLWREERGIPVRCDNEQCRFYSAELVWNGQPLVPILDHREGNRFDNSPCNLRLLCPNCDAQLPTRGGANRGRVQDLTEDGYTLIVDKKADKRIVAATFRAHGRSTFGAVAKQPDPTPEP